MLKKATSLLIALGLFFSSVGCVAAENTASNVHIKLSDTAITVDGQPATTDHNAAVYIGSDLIYYEAGQDSSYGEGTAADAHSAEEADAHTVVTITKPGTYILSGSLSAGQIAIDLGEDAEKDPNAVVTLILDGLDITNTVAPAVIFYNVYEPYSSTEDTKGVTDLSNAGAQVIIADDSVNKVQGSYVARIYKPGTTKKLHKYDGAFYSKMSMNISGEVLGSGELYITADNEGLDSELHLTLNGGKIYIQSQDDGINTNEDNISVTTINGGYLYINAGLGAEGDGIDSNGYLTINGGTIVTMSNERSPDGGIDADKDITINGGHLIALGTRNDAVSIASKQPYMELSFASTQAKGSSIVLKDAEANNLLEHTAEKTFQSLTFSSSDLALDTTYNLYVDGIQQQYTGNSTGIMGGFRGQGGNPPNNMMPPEDRQNSNRDHTKKDPQGNAPMNRPAGTTLQPQDKHENTANQNAEASVAFVLTESIRSFSGVTQAADASGKTKVSFTVNQNKGIANVSSGESITLTDITASLPVDPENIQITVTDIPSENYAEYGYLSDGIESIAKLLPTEDGTYQLTIAVVSTNSDYTGVGQWQFSIGIDLPFTDVSPQSSYYDAVKELYEAGVMLGTSQNTFSPNAPVNRAMAITVLSRLLGVEATETDTFTDVPSGSWYSGYVGWAASNKIVIGNGQGLFMPKNTLTSAELELILSRYAELKGIHYNSSGSGSEIVTRGQLAEVLQHSEQCD